MTTSATDLAYLRAKARVDRAKRFFTHLFIYLLVNLTITGFKVSDNLSTWNDFTTELTSFKVWINWALWGAFLVLHFFAYKFGQDWEERKINALMQKELTKEFSKK